MTRTAASLAAGFSLTLGWVAAASEDDKKNHASVIVGGTHVLDSDYTAFTLGVDLEYEITHHLGIGLVIEHAFEEVDATSLFGVVDIHLGHGFVVQAGPGVEWIDGKAYAAGRVGVFYEIDLEEIILAPSVSYDISEAEDSIVFGVAIGTKF